MSTQAVQVAVARADLIICQIAALPWEKIGLSVLIAVIIMKVGRILWRT